MSQKNMKLKDWMDARQNDGAPSYALSEPLRTDALSQVKAGVFPGPKDEEWRYTPVKALLGKDFGQTSSKPDIHKQIEDAKQAIPEAVHLVFVDGVYAAAHSDPVKRISGLAFKQLKAESSEEMSILETMLSQVEWSDNNIFKDLSLSLSSSATIFDVKSGTQIPETLQLIYVNSGAAEGNISTPLVFIKLGENSRLTIVEHFASSPDHASCTFPASFINLAQGAHLTHLKLGVEGPSHEHISNTHATLQRDARFVGHQYLLGSLMTRTNTEIKLDGPGAEVILRGIYLGENKQHLDIRTYIDHTSPHCNSDQHFRGILNDKSRGVFNGLVLVRQDAQQTDAQQSNKNLLLSDQARVDTKPQLEIFADDVKCAHGATVGQLDSDALFYLESRGIGKRDAELMLTRAFTAEVSDDIEIESLKSWLENAMVERLSKLSGSHA